MTLAQIAMAFGRSYAGKMLMMIDSVDGMINAAAAPITARLPISCHISLDSVASTAPNRKSTSPICSAPLRPKRSPSAPVVKRSPAKTRE